MREAGATTDGATGPAAIPMSVMGDEPRPNLSGTLCRIGGVTPPVSRRNVKKRSTEKEKRANILHCRNVAATRPQCLSVLHERFCDVAHVARSKKRTAGS